jgi:hypothetical protein
LWLSYTECETGKVTQHWTYTSAGELINKWWGMCATLEYYNEDEGIDKKELKLLPCDPNSKHY